ncbi:hypothetical protein [Brassicibacter mesophilus]
MYQFLYYDEENHDFYVRDLITNEEHCFKLKEFVRWKKGMIRKKKK